MDPMTRSGRLDLCAVGLDDADVIGVPGAFDSTGESLGEQHRDESVTAVGDGPDVLLLARQRERTARTPTSARWHWRMSGNAGCIPQPGFDLGLNVGLDVAVSQRALDDRRVVSTGRLPERFAGGVLDAATDDYGHDVARLKLGECLITSRGPDSVEPVTAQHGQDRIERSLPTGDHQRSHACPFPLVAEP